MNYDVQTLKIFGYQGEKVSKGKVVPSSLERRFQGIDCGLLETNLRLCIFRWRSRGV